jgi:hypothetical protein
MRFRFFFLMSMSMSGNMTIPPRQPTNPSRTTNSSTIKPNRHVNINLAITSTTSTNPTKQGKLTTFGPRAKGGAGAVNPWLAPRVQGAYTGPAAGQEPRYYDGYAMAHRSVKGEAQASSLKPLDSTEVFIGHDSMCATHPDGNGSFRAPPSWPFLISDEQARKITPFISSLNDGAHGATAGYIQMRNSKGRAISAKLRSQTVTIIVIAMSIREMHVQHARNLRAQESLTTTAPKTVIKPTRKAGRKPDREAEHERKPETEQQMRKRMQLESDEYARSRGVYVREPFPYKKLTPISVAAGSRRQRTKKKRRTGHAHCCIGGRCRAHAMHHAQATGQPEGNFNGSTTAQPKGEVAIAQTTTDQPEGEHEGEGITAQPEEEDEDNFENEEHSIAAIG